MNKSVTVTFLCHKDKPQQVNKCIHATVRENDLQINKFSSYLERSLNAPPNDFFFFFAFD